MTWDWYKAVTWHTVGGKTSVECRYFTPLLYTRRRRRRTSSVPLGTGNSFHWVLDLFWGKNACQGRDRTAARNQVLLRKITLNLARQALWQGHKRLINLTDVRTLSAWDVN